MKYTSKSSDFMFRISFIAISVKAYLTNYNLFVLKENRTNNVDPA